MSEPASFDLCGPLPTGVTLLEASAGTGKTFTIAGLTARYVAEGTPIDRLLVVTFTRAATSELRERVRARLVSAAAGLVPGAATSGDQLVEHLADAAPDVVALRRDRLERAVANFDAATIDTTHGFCLHVLAGLGVAGDVEPGVTLVEDARDLLAEVVDDLYVRKFWRHPETPPITRKEAVALGEKVLGNPGAVLVPELTDDDGIPAMRRRLAGRLVEEMDRRKGAGRMLTFDDLLTRLQATLADEARGTAACERLRRRYDVALIDEFQDTDLVQWDIVRRAFDAPGCTLVLIGDPKQAIYAFRGADVHSYLAASAAAANRFTLGTNWRSDQGLVDALEALLRGSKLGHAGIEFRTVRAEDAHQQPGLTGAPDAAPLRFRVLDRDDLTLTKQGYAEVGGARAAAARDVVAEIVALLSSGAELRGTERVRPGHLAVLVHTNDQATLVRDTLLGSGVPAVVAGGGSVFATTPAAEWLTLLQALEQPTARTRAAAVALTPFVGWQPAAVATETEQAWEDLHVLLHDWADRLRRSGVAALLEHLTQSQHIPARMLAKLGGERALADLRHVGELLYRASVGEDLGPAALTGWLHTRIAEAAKDVADEDRNRRLESDAEAVQVLTIHRSKGLEFPIVFCPFAWDSFDSKIKIPVFHDGDERLIDVGGSGGPGFQLHCEQAKAEQLGESLRLLYVALTRAQHQVTVWWCGSWGSRWSAFSRLLFDRADDGTIGEDASVPSDAYVLETLGWLGPRTSVTLCSGSASPTWARPEASSIALDTAVWDRTVDVTWRRTSYSGITAAAHDAVVASEPEAAGITDEAVPLATSANVPEISTDDDLRDVPLLLGDMPGGADVGTAVHTILEAVDFSDDDLDGALRAAAEAGLARRGVDLGDLDTLVAGLRAVIETPVMGDARLRDIRRADRLDELGFELPLAGGDAPGVEVGVSDIATVLGEWVGDGEPLSPYPARLGDPVVDKSLRGFLAGSLDLVVRLPENRFVVADYKTNWLGTADGLPLTAWHYRPAAMDEAMIRAHYPLQALLYSVALHRYLRWRVDGYDPERNLGGVRYLFVRGMSSGRPLRSGVWAWDPPAGLIVGLSDLFDRGPAALVGSRS